MAAKGHFGEPCRANRFGVSGDCGTVYDESDDVILFFDYSPAARKWLDHAVGLVNELDGISFEPGAVRALIQVANRVVDEHYHEPGFQALENAVLRIEVDDA